MNPLISVIIPVYRVEDYLRECVDSVINQTYKNLEIILVDDGSPDNCGKICDEYAQKDERVRVIHKKNGGLSDARNVGIAQSSGEYLMFVDSDDLLTEDSIGFLYDLIIKNNAQLAVGGRERFDSETNAILDTDFSEEESNTVFDKVAMMRNSFKNGCAAWARLYSREVHADIQFPVGKINEDEAIVLRILERCSRIAQSNHIVYRYRCRPESITTSTFSLKKLAWQKHCAQNLDFVREKYPELIPDAAARYRSSLLWSLSEIAMSDEFFPEETANMQGKLKTYYQLFKQIPFECRADKIRLFLLKYLPFKVYRTLLKAKRK